jgi:PadR family transcriptional regulator PadR
MGPAMTSDLGRELTTLEYIVLGLISVSPQSGYSIITTLENSASRWSASPGAIYPILKRLENQDLIAGELDMVYETRPRKLYRLTPQGETVLDDWLQGPLTPTQILEERDVALLKFLFAEHRLTRDQVLTWLDVYEEQTETYDAPRRVMAEVLIEESSLHQQLIHEMTVMELNMQRTWIQLARRRLLAAPPVDDETTGKPASSR